jgi:L-ascorbate metabolism protein UlaG (beta-lactamase superfamily)
MEITWYGHSCFRLTERNVATIVTDPYDASIGYALPKLKGDVVTISHTAPGHQNASAVKGALPITGPGEYEVGGVFITGVSSSQGAAANTIYVFDYDGLTVCHLGDLADVPSQRRLEALGTIDVVLIPVGGGGGLNATKAAEVVSLLEPSLVVPMHYKTEQNTLKLEPLAKFLKEMGLTHVSPQESLKITKDSLPEQTQVVVLEAKQ